MKQLIYLSGCLFLCLLLGSCQSDNKETEQSQYSTDVLFPRGKDCTNPAGYNYLISMENAQEKTLEDLLDSNYAISITPLQIDDPKHLLGEISKLWDYGDSLIYIADLQIANKIYAFNRDGKLKFVIDDTGQGPGQYKKMWDVQYNVHRKILQVWDLPQHKMLSFSLNGDFLEEKKINKEIVSFYPVTEDWYIYHLDGRDYMGQKKPLLLYSDISGEKVMKKGAWEYGMVDAFPSRIQFSLYDGSVYFSSAMMDTIYWIGPVNGQICPDYVIDFGKKKLPEEIKKQEDLMRIGQMIQQAGSSFSIGNLLVGRTFLHFEWLSNEKDREDKFFHFVDRHEYLSYKVREKNFSLFGIGIERLSFSKLHDFIGYSYLHKINKTLLKQAIASDKVHAKTKAELAKLLKFEEQEMPFLIQFRLKHTQNY
ncbi:6-bladed beta-propeller [Rhodoflexus caldus]|uniref:6-bladed beta-propeller n=1 Tax=Rhodoflexus caldus TaxID=2891236 RepID=UPI00202A4519|nr:6-bladed beta-propeller [Rhodoflexus caldus]